MNIWNVVVLCVSLVGIRSSECAEMRDGEILRLTLAQLHPSGKEAQQSIIIFSELTPEYVEHGRQGPAVPARRAQKLSQQEIQALMSNMVARNSIPGTNSARAHRVSFAAIDLGPRVVITSDPELTLKELRSKQVNANGWLEASLPGYSQDGRFAVVCMRRWSRTDGAFVRAFFERKDGNWNLLQMEMTMISGNPVP